MSREILRASIKSKPRLLMLCLFMIYFEVWAALPSINKSFRSSSAKTSGNQLTVSTGVIERTWLLNKTGLSTLKIKNVVSGHESVNSKRHETDWDLGDLGDGKLVSLRAFEDDDEKFTSKHLTVEVEIHYTNLHLKYIIWAYPDAPGIRTQIWLRKPQGAVLTEDTLKPAVSESLQLLDKPDKVIGFGYRAGLEAHFEEYEILREETVTEQNKVIWASGLITEDSNGGFILVKESQKHTHLRNALRTGSFELQGHLFNSTGLGIWPDNIKSDRYRFCWANWMIVYQGNNIDAQLALKKFDRIRYPIEPNRDIFIMANTWGTEDMPPPCKYKAREENVLRELQSCAELGVDLLFISAGWSDNSFSPVTSRDDSFFLHDGTKFSGTYEVYPEGFKNIRDRSEKLGVKLGLFHNASVDIEILKRNYDECNFKLFKLSHSYLKHKDGLDSLYYKARNFIKYTDCSAIVCWETADGTPRTGYYFGRDCGILYPVKRKAFTIRKDVQYDPWKVLRDSWELAKYINLNKILLPYQNKDLTPSNAPTDALKYTHSYNMAIVLMSSPLMFLETQYIRPEARKELKTVLEPYKLHRKDMYQGYVFALGDKPDNASWSGFQNYNPKTNNSYLTIFRELNNKKSKAKIALHFYKSNTRLKMTDLITGEISEVKLDNKNQAEFHIPKAPGFKFSKIEVTK